MCVSIATITTSDEFLTRLMSVPSTIPSIANGRNLEKNPFMHFGFLLSTFEKRLSFLSLYGG